MTVVRAAVAPCAAEAEAPTRRIGFHLSGHVGHLFVGHLFANATAPLGDPIGCFLGNPANTAREPVHVFSGRFLARFGNRC